MINLTRLYCDVAQPMDHLRYGRGHGAPTSAAERRPIELRRPPKSRLLTSDCFA